MIMLKLKHIFYIIGSEAGFESPRPGVSKNWPFQARYSRSSQIFGFLTSTIDAKRTSPLSDQPDLNSISQVYRTSEYEWYIPKKKFNLVKVSPMVAQLDTGSHPTNLFERDKQPPNLMLSFQKKHQKDWLGKFLFLLQ